jgi:hypothetical protein
MAQYTLTLKQLKENNVPLFNFNYPIFNEEYRPILEDKIIRHFYFREIGFETIGRFLFELETKLNEIMPFYNKMYESTLLEFDPLLNYQVKETYEKMNVGNTQGNANSNTTGLLNEKTNQLFSDTPQGRVDFNTSSHVTTMSQDVNTSSTSNDSTISQSQSNNNREEFVRTMEGNIGVQTFSQLINDYRKTFINVDLMVMDELNELFMRVY